MGFSVEDHNIAECYGKQPILEMFRNCPWSEGDEIPSKLALSAFQLPSQWVIVGLMFAVFQPVDFRVALECSELSPGILSASLPFDDQIVESSPQHSRKDVDL